MPEKKKKEQEAPPKEETRCAFCGRMSDECICPKEAA